jgi:pilus assembly protein Flp/PilA
MDLVTYFHDHVAPFVRARRGRSERGASLVEYALLVALIAVVCIVAITFIGTRASDKFSEVGSKLS